MARAPKKPRIAAWWKQTDDFELAREVFETVCYLDEDQQDRREKNLRCLRLYGNVDLGGVGPYSYARAQTPNLPENRVKYNIAAACTDTVASKISKMKPNVTFLTGGGNWEVQSRAKSLSKWTKGAFYQNDVYALHQYMFRDALIFDLAALKHFRVEGKICSERVLPTEIYVDSADAMYGKPSHLYHVKYVHKDILAEQFPKQKAAIMESSGSLDPESVHAMREEEREYVVVIEAWHLPSSADSKDGKHVIAVEKGVLVSEDYTRSYFPFTFMRWSNPVVGFYGQSLVDRLTGNQIEINKMLRIIQRSFHLGSAFKVFLEYGSKVAKEHINNEIGSIVYYAGAKPEFYTPKTVHEEFFRHLEWLIRSSFEEAGVSQLSATSKLPMGLDGGSGKALREYNDLETERFVLTAQQYEQSFLETARQYIDLAREMKEDGIDMEVTAESKRFVEQIAWSDIDLETNQYIMQMYPTSGLPQTPAGKLAYVQELIQAGFLTQEEALSLLEFPDVEGVTALKLAPYNDILATLDRMLYHGEFVSPEPFQNLDLGLKMMQSAYLKAKNDGAPEDRLELLREWMAAADAMKAKAQSAQVGAPLANPVPQGGAAMPPPAPMPAPGMVPQASPSPTPQVSPGAAPLAA